MRTPRTWLVWLGAIWGAVISCARAPAQAPDTPEAPSEHAKLADTCRCIDEASAEHLAVALAGIHGHSQRPAPDGDFVACASAISGIPSAAAYAASDDTPSWSHLPEDQRGLLMNEDATLTVGGVFGTVLVGERSRLRSIAVAFRENALACQACQAIAIAVATHALTRGEPSHADRGLVDDVAKRARAAATRAALALGLSAALDATLRRKLSPDELTTLAERLDAHAPDGELSDATSRVWSIAGGLQSDALSGWLDRERPALEARGRRPVRMSATPSLPALARVNLGAADAARHMLAGLSARNIGAVMRGAAPLYGPHDPARLLLEATTRALSDDFAGALSVARDVVPIYSGAAEPLERLDERLGGSR